MNEMGSESAAMTDERGRALMSNEWERAEALRRSLVARHGAAPERVRVVRSPYRVCPLGAHIDHQLGPVTAMAIDQSVFLAYAPSDSPFVRLGSLDFPGTVEFTLDDVPGRRADDWGNFPRGAARALQVLVGTEGVYGARFSGAGFRGCCVALVRPESAGQAAGRVREAYRRRHPELAADASVHLCDSADCAALLEPPLSGRTS
jgi:galactokinase